MTGTSEGGKKAAETRGHDSLSKAGQKGGQHSHGNNNQDNNQSGKTNRSQDQDNRK